MTTTVFLSGSRKISRLNDMIRRRIERMLNQGFHIVVGDANGADKAIQNYLAEAKYGKVKVFCAGRICRNNIGEWDVKNINVNPKLKGRNFYTQKDKAMAFEADYGFVLWDGKSAGSVNNIVELLIRQKLAVVYFAPKKEFHTMKRLDDVYTLLKHCDEIDYRKIIKKIGLDYHVEDLGESPQGALSLYPYSDRVS